MSEPVWLSRAVVEFLHREQVREHGGALKARDEGLLESALARPRQRLTYEPASDLSALAASYGYGLIMNHPFLDGNKRIGFVAMNVFLILNGFEIDVPEAEAVDTVLLVADNRMDEEGLAEWLRRVVVPATV